jgi:hypothetical protein
MRSDGPDDILVGADGTAALSGKWAKSLEAEEAEEEELPDDPVVTAVEVYSLIEAEIICSLLDSQGIPCILQAENQYAVDANYNIGPLARRRILVRQSDLAEARDILRAVPEAESPPER